MSSLDSLKHFPHLGDWGITAQLGYKIMPAVTFMTCTTRPVLENFVLRYSAEGIFANSLEAFIHSEWAL